MTARQVVLIFVVLAPQLLACASGTRGTQARTVAILPLNVAGDPASRREPAVRRAMAEILKRRPEIRLSDASAVQRALDREAACQGKQRFKEPCALGVGDLVGARYVVSGAVGGLEKTFIVQLKLLDTRRGGVTRSLEEAHFGGATGLEVVVEKMVRQLFRFRKKKPWYTRWWIWAGVAGVVATAVVVPVVVMQEDDPYEEIPLP
jgi:hypothetical protein